VPPLDRIFLIGIWVETLIYGKHIIVFTAAIFVLARLQKARQASIRFLTGTSIFLIMLSTAYVGLSLRELIQAFILGPPGGASLFFADTAGHLLCCKVQFALKLMLAYLIQSLSIWRMWVVYQHRWMVIVLPSLSFEHHILTHITAADIFALYQIRHPSITIFDPMIHNTVIAYMSLHLMINVGVTSSIAYTLWKAGRSVPEPWHIQPKDTSIYGLILTIVESGGVYTAAIIVAASLYFSGNVAALAAIDSLMQLATITPLLINCSSGFWYSAWRFCQHHHL
ncbi:hypothetical protein BT96DRAFT_1089590, partial [Gymnopus androsaceus JB14]